MPTSSCSTKHGSTIALLSNTAWSMYNFRKGLIEEMLARGVQVLIIAPRDAYTEKLQNMGCRVEEVSINQYGANPFEDIRYFRQLLAIFRRYSIRFVITYTIKPNIYGNLAARLQNIPSLAVITGLGHLFTNPSFKTRIAGALYRLALRGVKQVWFLNQEDEAFFQNRRFVRRRQTACLPGEGINTDFFRKKPEEEVSKEKSPFTFLFAGRLMTEKGIRDFVEAARLFKSRFAEVQFELLGFLEAFPHGVSEQEVLGWHREGVVRYLGAAEDVRAHLQRVDCVVLPTYYREGVPRILLEAASLEKPIIATENVGCTEIVAHGVNGFLCQKRNPEDLSRWMEAMYRLSGRQRAEMGRQGRNMVIRSFGEQNIIGHYFQLLREYIPLPAPAAAAEPVVEALEVEISEPLKKKAYFSG